MTDDQIIAVVTAHKEGKKIQIRRRSEDEMKSDYGWKWGESINWDFRNLEYRVSPKSSQPREWFFRVYEDGTAGSPSDERWAIECGKHERGSKIVRVREVIE